MTVQIKAIPWERTTLDIHEDLVADDLNVLCLTEMVAE